MDYKSSYNYSGEAKVLTVKMASTGGIFLGIIGLIVLAVGIFGFFIWKEIWALLLGGIFPLLAGAFMFWMGIVSLGKKSVFTIGGGNLLVEHKGKGKKLPSATIPCDEIEAVKKKFNTVAVGKGQKMDFYPITIYKKNGEAIKIMEIVGDVKMAYEIRQFVRKRSGLIDRK
ncbi:MAG: hypothetical protein AAGF89_07355 [Bacteroidota bacterium]